MTRRLPLLLLTATALALASSSHAAEPLHAKIDKLLAAKPLGTTAKRSTDAEFLRRTYLNLTGTIPTSAVARKFLDDKSPDKRAKLIDRLLNSPQHVRHMTDFFDVMFTERHGAKFVSTADWRKYLYDSLAADKPYNQLAREILAGDSSDPKTRPGARLYFDRNAEVNQLTRDVGRIFFGKDLQCAQCHNHPLVDNYFQADYYGLYAALNRTYIHTNKAKKLTVLAEKAEGQTAGFKSVFTNISGRTLPRIPGGAQLTEPVFARGLGYKPAKDGLPAPPKYSRRERLANEATDGKNRAFNRNIVNRLWKQMLGRGLVEPVDFLHPDNPPSHPELMNLLTKEFVAMKFQVKPFLREIALTEVYQRSFEPPAELKFDAAKLTSHIAKLQAEQKRLDAVRANAERLVIKLEKELAPLKAAAEKIEGELSKADAAIAAAEKKAAPSRKALAAAKSRLASSEALLISLNAALAKTTEVAKKLPKDKEIAAALKTFNDKAAQTNSQIPGLKKAVADKEKAAKPFEDKITAAQHAAGPIIAKLTAARAKLVPVDQKLAAATKQWKANQTALNGVTRRLEYAQHLAKLTRAKHSLATSRGQLAAYTKQQTEQTKKLAALTKQFEQQQAAVNELTKQKTAADAALQTAKTQLAENQSLATTLAEALKQANAAKAKLPKDAALAKAVGTLKSKHAAYQKQVPAAAKDVTAKEAAVKTTDGKLAAAKKQLQPLLAMKAAVAKLESDIATTQSNITSHQAAITELRDKISKTMTARFAVRPLQPLTPEQLTWSLMQATGYAGRIRQSEINALVAKNKQANPKYAIPTDPKAQRAFDTQIERAVYNKLKGNIGAFVNLFGAGSGQPQHEFFSTVDQALFLSNGGQIRGWLSPSGTNLTARLLKLKDANAIAEELYLSILTRRPTQTEIKDVADYLKTRDKDRPAALQELAWGLLTSAEFRFNH